MSVAYDLPATQFRSWLSRAGVIWRANWSFFIALSVFVVIVRRTFDSMTFDFLILVSYFTDAWIFAWLFLGLRDRTDTRGWSVVRAGWRALKGRFFRVFKTGLWGIPAAITSFVIFLLAPQVAQVMAVLQGNTLAATLVLFLALCAGGMVSLLLSLLPVLAAVQAARDPHATLQSSGLWAWRAIRAGLRPLAVLFVAFVLASLVGSLITTYLTGNLPIEFFSDWPIDLVEEALVESPVTMVFVMNAFLALLYPMASDLLRSADIDLSDEVFSDADKTTHGDAFWVMVLQRAGSGLRGLAALSLVFLAVYASFSGLEEAARWLGYSIVAYVWGGSFEKSARAWRERLSWSLRYRFITTPVFTLLLVLAGIIGLEMLEDDE